MSTPVPTDQDVAPTPKARRRLFASTMIGNAVEYYDFTLYGTLAAVIASHFFPEGQTTVALLAAYVGVALSYFIRPIGAMILGPLADLKGRRPVLVLTIVLMTVGTAGIGLLPTYAAAGVVAPILLLTARVVQGLGASVEITTAANFLLEHENKRRRNYVLGTLNSTASVGSFLAAGVAFLFTQLMSSEAFASWGWRIPFLLAIPLSAVAVYIRNRLNESPEFEAVRQLADQRKVPQTPLRTAVRYYWPDMLRSIGLSAGQRIGSFVIQAYFVTALVGAGFPTSLALLASMISYAVGPVPSIYGGYLADKYGARVPLLIGYGLFVVLTVPTFIAIGSKSILIAVLAVVGFTIINNIISAPMMAAAILSFPSEVRSSASALNFNVSTSLIGSTAGLVAVWLRDITGSDVTFGWYMTGFCVLSLLITIFALPTGARRDASTGLLAETAVRTP
ncbi:MFS transporter [Nonomuraea sp. NEAU-A123]|uniref:MFS transporter n=1 Tax=Nonomuraea sp. NEAU-A123 TaxID=2839649 RepID=UPI001BE488C0|nr:MFS transporter [Nonomuraea sp. NEAU-A123]MBT2233301.1 MFS transporter [Nonomuraea sp. NEAU-A123]